MLVRIHSLASSSVATPIPDLTVSIFGKIPVPSFASVNRAVSVCPAKESQWNRAVYVSIGSILLIARSISAELSCLACSVKEGIRAW